MRAVAGRMKSDYQYSNTIVYNNFPWPTSTDEQKAKIEQTAQAILDARSLYPDWRLADLYDEATMPPSCAKPTSRTTGQSAGIWFFRQEHDRKQLRGGVDETVSAVGRRAEVMLPYCFFTKNRCTAHKPPTYFFKPAYRRKNAVHDKL